MTTHKNGVTVVITAYNEENNIQDCIKSAFKLAKDVIVVDTESTDLTKDRAQELGISVYSFPFSTYVEPSRNFAIEKAQTDWVFILDADERITDEVAKEINDKTSRLDFTYYFIPRRNIFARKKWLKYGGWYPDYIIRLINKDHFESWPVRIHSTPHIRGTSGKLTQPLDHYFQPSLEFMVNKTAIYEDVESDLLLKAQRRVSTGTLFRKFFGELYRRLILNRGFLDGTYGIIESFYQAFSKTITYIFLYEKYEKSTSL